MIGRQLIDDFGLYNTQHRGYSVGTLQPMCKLPAIFLRLLAGMACLLACACFDIKEEVWIGSDGSGRAVLSYQVPCSAVTLAGGSEALAAKIREAIGKQEKLKLDGVRVEGEGERATVEVKISTDSVLSLRDLDDSEDFASMPSAAVDLAGKFDVHRQGLDIDFARTIRVREALGLASYTIRDADRQNRRLIYIFHLPTPASESNATEILNEGKTLVWDSSLGDALSQPLVTRFKARIPVPRTVWLAAGSLGLALIGLLLRLRVSRRRRREQES